MAYFGKVIKYYSSDIHDKIEKHVKARRDARVIASYPKTYGVIVRDEKHRYEGLFASYLAIVKQIYTAREMGLVPVVDMQSQKNSYLEDDEVGKINSFESFFEQPMRVSLDHIQGKKNVIYLFDPPDLSYPCDKMEFLTNDDEVAFWRKFCKQYMRLSSTAIEYLHQYDDLLKEIIQNKTLGVYLRGTDYKVLMPVNHPVVPDIDESIQKTKEIMQQCGCKYIFLSAEDEEMQNAFLKEFGNQCLYVDQVRYDSKNVHKEIMGTERFSSTDIRDTGFKYLTAVYLMSKCSCLLAARCSGSVGAFLMSDGYEYSYFWNKGRYRENHLGLFE